MTYRGWIIAARAEQRRIRRARNKALVKYRLTTRLSGPEPAPNPPRTGALLVHGNPLAGAASIQIRSAVIFGRAIAGDQFLIDGRRYEAAADATAVANILTITLTEPTLVNLTDGMAVEPEWKADTPVWSEVEALSRRLVEGVQVEARDLLVTIPAKSLPRDPWVQDIITLPDGDKRQVVFVVPVLEHGLPISFRLQVR